MLVPRHRAVHVTPTVAKASAGAIEHVPIALVAGLPGTLSRLKDHKIWVVGLDDAADRTLFDIGDLAREGICLVLGAEGAGLSRLVRERCDVVVSIPMRGRLGSLNISAADNMWNYHGYQNRRNVYNNMSQNISSASAPAADYEGAFAIGQISVSANIKPKKRVAALF